MSVYYHSWKSELLLWAVFNELPVDVALAWPKDAVMRCFE